MPWWKHCKMNVSYKLPFWLDWRIFIQNPSMDQPGWKKGFNFTNVLRAAFMGVDPKSTKKIDNLTVFLRFWDLGK